MWLKFKNNWLNAAYIQAIYYHNSGLTPETITTEYITDSTLPLPTVVELLDLFPNQLMNVCPDRLFFQLPCQLLGMGFPTEKDYVRILSDIKSILRLDLINLQKEAIIKFGDREIDLKDICVLTYLREKGFCALSNKKCVYTYALHKKAAQESFVESFESHMAKPIRAMG